MIQELPVLNCDDCGACCMTMNAPPGYCGMEQIIFVSPEDEQRFQSAPDEAREAVYDWSDRIDAIPDGDPLPKDGPCCWFDVKTKRCKWYEYRPSVCREFEVGSEGCRTWRDEFNIDMEAIQ